MPPKSKRKTESPLEVAQLCVERLTTALRAANPDPNVPDAQSLAIRVSGDKKLPKKTRALAEALSLAIPSCNELQDPLWLLRRQAAAATQTLQRDVQEWGRLVSPIVEYNLERERKLGRAAALFPASFLPWLVAFIHGGMGYVALLTNLQLLNPDTRSRGRRPDHVKDDVTRILDRAGCSVSEIAELTERVNDRSARTRVRNRLGELKKRREGK